VQAADVECAAANVDENDHTVFSYVDLEFELQLLEQGIEKRKKFLDNQIVSRNMTNLTPAQLEQFESTFRYFDKDETNTLDLPEMSAALASLGIVYSVPVSYSFPSFHCSSCHRRMKTWTSYTTSYFRIMALSHLRPLSTFLYAFLV
jgi:hypothetical protein